MRGAASGGSRLDGSAVLASPLRSLTPRVATVGFTRDWESDGR